MRRPWALPFVPLYRLGLGVSNAASKRRRVKQLGWPVVSVGSLSAGGAGKTPLVMALAELFARHGIGVDVLSRGYGRGSGAIEQVDPVGPALRFGDEPLEMARAGLRVFVGAERFAAGKLAEAAGLTEDSQPQNIHLLDDGFQHRQLGRAVNVVLLTLEDAQDWLLPAGNLREPLSALRRADVVVVRAEEAEALYELVRTHTKAKFWVVRRTLELPPATPRKVLAFCGIARPDGFFAMLEQSGCEVVGRVTFPDHHRYRHEDFERLAAAAVDAQAQTLVTTAKDAVKFSTADKRVLEAARPLIVARLQVSLAEEDRVWQEMRALLGWNGSA